MTRTILALLLTAAAVGTPAYAQDDEQLNQKCFQESSPDRAIVACTAVIARSLVSKSDLASAFKHRGNAFDEKDDLAHAIDDYDHAIAIDPTDADAFNDRGTSRLASGDVVLAIRDFDEAVRLSSSPAMALSNRCFAMALAERPEQGLADCNESFRLRPKNANTLASRGFVYLKLKRYDAAITDYDAELRLNPGNPYTLFGRGIAKRLSGNSSEGDADIAAARVIKSDIADAMAKLGVQS